AEIGAVRATEVRDLVIAERRPDLVHVSGCVLRRIEPQRVAVLRLATVGEPRLGLVFQGLFGGRVRSFVDVQVLVLELIGHAADATRAVDAPRIKADQIERLETQRRGERLPADGDEVEARRTGPTRV